MKKYWQLFSTIKNPIGFLITIFLQRQIIQNATKYETINNYTLHRIICGYVTIRMLRS